MIFGFWFNWGLLYIWAVVLAIGVGMRIVQNTEWASDDKGTN